MVKLFQSEEESITTKHVSNLYKTSLIVFRSYYSDIRSLCNDNNVEIKNVKRVLKLIVAINSVLSRRYFAMTGDNFRCRAYR